MQHSIFVVLDALRHECIDEGCCVRVWCMFSGAQANAWPFLAGPNYACWKKWGILIPSGFPNPIAVSARLVYLLGAMLICVVICTSLFL